MEWLVPVLIVVGVILLVGIYLWATYNSLVQLNVRVDEAWSGITVQLKRRADLIPNLIETVKGYAAHEKAVFENVTRARAETIGAQTPAEAGVAEGHMQQALKSLFAVAEAYPELKANENFMQLQQRITSLENGIADRRELYNDAVNINNVRVEQFPDAVIARAFSFESKPLLEFSTVEKADVDLKQLFS